MNAKFVMVVEDDPTIRLNLTYLLEFEGHRVYQAKNGQDALELLSTVEVLPDVILLDLMMPVCSGRDFLAIFSKDQRFSTIPVILTSAATDAASVAGQYGTQFISKPMDVDQLLSIIQTSMSSGEAASPLSQG